MKILVLSYFDTHVGPDIFLIAPESFSVDKVKHLTNFLDLDGNDFFVHEFDEFISVNLKFIIKSDVARGNIESLMVSILLKDEEPNAKVLKEILKTFVEDFKKIKSISNILNIKTKDLPENVRKFEEVQKFFYNFYDNLPKETVYVKKRHVNLFMFGLDNAGKTTIINRIKKNVFTNPKATAGINVIKLLFANLSITAYDAGGQKQYRKIWAAQLKNQDGLIFTVDISNDKRFNEANTELHRVINLPDVKDLPLLILFNKVDLKKIDLNQLTKDFELNKIKERKVRMFYTSAKTNEGITDAFNWIALEMLNRLF